MPQRIRTHVTLTPNQMEFLEIAYPGLGRSEALRRIIDNEIIRRDWEPVTIPKGLNVIEESDTHVRISPEPTSTEGEEE